MKYQSKDSIGCCGAFRVESLIAVDERGQMVLPKEVREKAHIQPGEKLALVAWEQNGHICCLMLIKADELAQMVRERLGPIFQAALNSPGTEGGLA
ncbi:MAG: AbrB/MazE/SpoVT family DNA-binding domain-containing protein [Bryobacteraceae bacterium]|jgi:AbrB family looped-hinge helix DNA binding protein|nr:AbrB/MazE/SpoVT family DNA-binding domain-containing protein [Bryobacteraceae bacterium]